MTKTTHTDLDFAKYDEHSSSSHYSSTRGATEVWKISDGRFYQGGFGSHIVFSMKFSSSCPQQSSKVASTVFLCQCYCLSLRRTGIQNVLKLDVSTALLARPLARSLPPLTRSLATHCSLCSRAPLRSLVRSLAPSLAPELVGQ